VNTLTRFLGLEEVGPVTYFEWFLRHPWPSVVVLVLILIAIGFTVAVYRGERGISKTRRYLLGAFRAVLYTVLIVMLFEPVFGIEMTVKLRESILVLLDKSESMAIRDVRKRQAELEEAALALGHLPFDKTAYALPAQARKEAEEATRMDLARGIVDNPNLDIFKRLGEDFKIRYFCFGERLEPTSGEGETLVESLRRVRPTAKATRLGTAVEEAVSRYSGQPIAGVILLTDGASNEGLEPLEVARRMKDKDVPLFAVGIGRPDPPDVRVEGLIVQDTVFSKDKVPVRFRVLSEGYAGRTVDVTVSVNGKEVARKPVKLSGEPQFQELTFVPEEETGSLKLDVAIAPLPGEIASENNQLTQKVRVINDKIKVLYVEGKPRWEYRYLRAVLLRDHRLDVKFLMTQGDRDLAKASDRYLDRFPEVASEAFVFDLVILGDVPASYFTPMQLSRMEELVRERGGSLLVLAGHQHPLAAHLGTPIASILPVKLRAEGWEAIDSTVHPVMTSEGDETTVVSLDVEKNEALWALVKPIYQVPVLEGAKPAATVLATLSDAPRRRAPYPLIAWQRYGRGKSMFVGTDQLWRLRFKRGDKYHARFWGQVIQFLTLSRLLGENKRIHIETGPKSFRTGERVQIYTNVLNGSYEPVTTPSYTLFAEQREPKPGSTPVRLEPVKDVPGLYQGFFTPEEAGTYVLRTAAAEAEASNTVEIQVATTPLEQLEPAMQEDLLKKMADLSGGRFLTVRELPSLPDSIQAELQTTIVRREKELWDLPLVFAVLLGCAAIEWFFRRRWDLI